MAVVLMGSGVDVDARLDARELRFARRVKAMRVFRGYTQAQVADKLGICRVSVSDIENGRRGVRLGEALTLAEVLDVSLADLLAEQPLTLAVSIAD